MVSLHGITKVYYTDEIETHALSKVDLQVNRGEFLSISGPSGSGKSTLLSVMGLLDPPSAGIYLLDGEPVHSLGVGERARIRNRKIGFIFQSFHLIGGLTVFENVELPLRYRQSSGANRAKIVNEALDRVNMSHRRNHYPAQISGGEQQRVAVARAVVGQPLILLADEPTGNLDSKNAEAVMQLLSELHRGGSAICMVTHDDRFARYAERTVNLFDGLVERRPE